MTLRAYDKKIPFQRALALSFVLSLVSGSQSRAWLANSFLWQGMNAAACAASGGTWGTTLIASGGCDWVYTNPGTFTWTAPKGVTSVSMVCVGGGGGVRDCNGGGGGGLGWLNNFSVAPGSSYTVKVGAGVSANSYVNGGDSYFKNATTVKGGGGGGNNGCPSSGGAGGAGIYGAIGGGVGGGGGGVGLYGQGASGGAQGTAAAGGFGGSGGVNGTPGTGGGSGGTGGNYGGGAGGGGAGGGGGPGGVGAGGACRIIWPGTSRLFPSTLVGAP